MPTDESIRAHTSLRGSRIIPFPPKQVFALLTPEGERNWIEGWAPVYPGSATPEERPGTAFLTSHHGHEAVWLIADKDDARCRASYAYVIAGVRATLVRVACEEVDGRTRATIHYDMAALTQDHDEEVAAFGQGFEGMLDDWQVTLTRTLQATARPPA